ncbi:MAG TPA: RNA 2',3'-cyclic phosphodiesterase [Candidatus Nanoarchaeia archaeon]|nr:RNA 2',3'-cyclic phosphodiesterase [Candidatus Nanoarchaeia archaeon]
MRLFIAINLPSNVKDYLFDLYKKINSSNVKVNWTHKKNLHMTMKFIGEVEDFKVNEIKDRLNHIEYKKFSLNLETIGFFPNNDFIRIIWIGVNPEEKVIELQKKIDSSLLDLISKDQRFDAHLTIGRVKNIKNREEFIKKIKDTKLEKIQFEVNEFKLMKSTLSKDGPTYEEIANFVL